MGDININTHDNHCQGVNDLKEFCDIFGLVNLIKTNTCDTKTSSSSIDVILTNKCKSFRFTRTIKTGISDVHRLVMTSLRSTYERLRPTRIQYRSYKNFNSDAFLSDLKKPLFINVYKLVTMKKLMKSSNKYS